MEKLVINRLRVKVISVILALTFVFGCTTSAYAQEPVKISEQSVTNEDLEEKPSEYKSLTRFSVVNTKKAKKITLKVTNITDSSAKLQWNSKSVGVSFNIYRYNPFTNEYDYYASTASNHYDLKGLTPGTQYKFLLGLKDTTIFYGTVDFLTQIRKPELKVNDVSSTSVELKVSNVTENSKVDIYKGTSAKNMKKVATVKGDRKYVDKKVKSKASYVYKAVASVSSPKEKKTSNSKTVKVSTPKAMGLPAVSGKTKTYAFYTAVTARRSPQYKLLHSAECYTDKETGIRKIGDYYCIALGSYYGTKIGTKYRITLSSGKTFKAILCDQKANQHTDGRHQYAVQNKDIIEFYVQRGYIPRGVNGNYGNLKQFKGSVVKIEKF